MEALAAGAGGSLENMDGEALETLWEQAKAALRQ
jgi:hypothetical protein